MTWLSQSTQGEPVHTVGAQLGPCLSLPRPQPGASASRRSGDPKSKTRERHGRGLPQPASPPRVHLGRDSTPPPRRTRVPPQEPPSCPHLTLTPSQHQPPGGQELGGDVCLQSGHELVQQGQRPTHRPEGCST